MIRSISNKIRKWIQSLNTRIGKKNKEYVAQELKKTKSDLQVNPQAPLLQGVANQCNQNLQVENQDLRIRLEKSLLEKDEENLT